MQSTWANEGLAVPHISISRISKLLQMRKPTSAGRPEDTLP